MTPDPRFLRLPKRFWANVRLLSQEIGYVERAPRGQRRSSRCRDVGAVKVPTRDEILETLERQGLGTGHVQERDRRLTDFGQMLIDYFAYRASVLNAAVKNQLMDLKAARRTFNELRKQLRPACPLPMNKQKGSKKQPAYFTGIVNMLIWANAQGMDCDFAPLRLTTVTRDDVPVRTLARRIDGAFPGPVDPVAVWEIKEYYHTTTFGSRVADGVYETLLDGMELEELREHEGIHVRHYLIIDDYFTWWICGRSYLCRIIDMLHMGYVDEVLFGREVLDRLPRIVKEWIALVVQRST